MLWVVSIHDSDGAVERVDTTVQDFAAARGPTCGVDLYLDLARYVCHVGLCCLALQLPGLRSLPLEAYGVVGLSGFALCGAAYGVVGLVGCLS